MADPKKQAVRRKSRVRGTIRKVSSGRARLSVFRSSKHIYAQVIDDLKGETIVSASSRPPRPLESCSRSGLRPKASPISSSIVAAINFTGA
jgi:large subunit ribosomal protein L18